MDPKSKIVGGTARLRKNVTVAMPNNLLFIVGVLRFLTSGCLWHGNSHGAQHLKRQLREAVRATLGISKKSKSKTGQERTGKVGFVVRFRTAGPGLLPAPRSWGRPAIRQKPLVTVTASKFSVVI